MGKITRRDFVNGTLVMAGASFLPLGCQVFEQNEKEAVYPPALTGLRGSQPGSNTHAHNLAWNGSAYSGSSTRLDEHYDLVVVGGGISGLSAAYFFLEKYGRDKKVLILDNHDDFGGHARRNEHTINGQLRITNGGSQTLVSPHTMSKTVLDLLQDVGIDLNKFKTAYDTEFYQRFGLGAVTYFNKQKFGEDKIVNHPFSNYPWWVEGLPRPTLSNVDAVNQTPLSEGGKEQLLRILEGGIEKLDVPIDQLESYLYSTLYFDYLTKTLKVDDQGVLEMARTSCSDWAGGGADVLSIGEAIDCGALGFDSVKTWKSIQGEVEFNKGVENHGNIFADEDPYIHHFPDGNATVARMLVKNLVPNVANGRNADDILLSRFDYSQLDVESNTTKIRLNSTVVNVDHIGKSSDSDKVSITYINEGQPYCIEANSVVMACYNMMIPHIVSGLPKKQEEALRRSTKIPLQYTTVGLKNWKAIEEIGMGMAMCPGNMHQVTMMDFPVSLGGYNYTATPEQPCAIQMISCPFGTIPGTPPIEQFKEVRHTMLATKFSDYEKEVRSHLSGMFKGKTFDFDKDVESITVNRWAHGYVYSGSQLFDSDQREMARIGRRRFGRITIANIDSAPSSYAHVAIEQAHRAIEELEA